MAKTFSVCPTPLANIFTKEHVQWKLKNLDSLTVIPGTETMNSEKSNVNALYNSYNLVLLLVLFTAMSPCKGTGIYLVKRNVEATATVNLTVRIENTFF